MPRLGYGPKLLREFVRFARDNRIWWIVPLALFLGIAAFVVVAGQTAAPLIYTLF